MEVNGPSSIRGIQPVKPMPPATAASPTSEPKPVATGDQVEISAASQMLDKIQQSPEVRAERLAQIKAAIDAGEYETPERLEAALGRLLDEIDSSSEK